MFNGGERKNNGHSDICREGPGNKDRPGRHRVQTAVGAGQLSPRPGRTAQLPTAATIPSHWDGVRLRDGCTSGRVQGSGIFPCFPVIFSHLRDGTDQVRGIREAGPRLLGALSVPDAGRDNK